MPRRKNSNAEPLVGIWWDDGRTIVAFAHPTSENSSNGPLIDSEFNHFELWEKAASQFDLSSEDEYFDVPRGRVLLRRQTGEGLVYHGNATSSSRLRKIAARFKLSEWTAQRNEHYDMGPEADAQFDDEFDDV
jgi:hypothetical protein